MASNRILIEYIHQLQHLGDDERLLRALSRIELLDRMIFAYDTHLTIRHEWRRLIVTGRDIGEKIHLDVDRFLRVTDNSRVRTDGLRTAATALMWLERPVEAIEWFRRSLEEAKALGEPLRIARAERPLAFLLARQGEFQEAIEKIDHALTLYIGLDDHVGISVAYGDLGSVYSIMGDHKRALEIYHVAERIAREKGDRLRLQRVLGNLGYVHHALGDVDEAIESFREQGTVARAIGFHEGWMEGLYGEAYIHAQAGNLDEALRCTREHDAVAREAGLLPGFVSSSTWIADLLAKSGALDKALELYGEIIETMTMVGNHSQARVAIGNMGNVHFVLGNMVAALDCYDRSERIARDTGSRVGEMINVGNRGCVYYQLGEFDRALDCLYRASASHRETRTKDALVECLDSSAHLLITLIENSASMPSYLPRYIPGIEELTWIDTTIAVARSMANESIGIARELNLLEPLFTSSILLARLDAIAGQRENAIETLSSMLRNEIELPHRAQLHFWLWKIDSQRHSNRDEAMGLYRELVEKTPTHEYRARLTELEATGGTDV